MSKPRPTAKKTPVRPRAKQVQTASRDPRDAHVKLLLTRSQELLKRHGVHEQCSVEVERQGRWYVLRGRVDSHRTRSQLFSMVPKKDGARWIVDHLRVGIDTRRKVNS